MEKLRLESPRTLAYLHKENAPDIEEQTVRGEYRLVYGGIELHRWEIGDPVSQNAMRAFVALKMRDGYRSREYPQP